MPTKEQYLDWDQRHMVNGNIQFRIHDTEDQYGIFKNSGINLIVQYGSGRPYTYAPNAGREVIENNKRLPWTLTFDVRLDKRFILNQNMSLLTYLQVDNIFDRENVAADYFQQGGDAGDSIKPEWYAVLNALDGIYDDPKVYRPGRTFRLGMSLMCEWSLKR